MHGVSWRGPSVGASRERDAPVSGVQNPQEQPEVSLRPTGVLLVHIYADIRGSLINGIIV